MLWASFNFVSQIWRDAQSVVQRGMQVGNCYRVLEYLARSLVGGFAIEKALTETTAEHQDGAGLSEMSVHPVVFRFRHDFRLLDLLLDGFVWLTLDHHVATELTG